MTGPGFYKRESHDLLYAAAAVHTVTNTLLAVNRKDYKYPVDGWYWFESEQDARKQLQLPLIDGFGLPPQIAAMKKGIAQ